MLPENYFRYIDLQALEEDEIERANELLSYSGITHITFDDPNNKGEAQQVIGFLRTFGGDPKIAYRHKYELHNKWVNEISAYIDKHQQRLYTEEVMFAHANGEKVILKGFDKLYQEAKVYAQQEVDKILLEKVMAYLATLTSKVHRVNEIFNNHGESYPQNFCGLKEKQNGIKSDNANSRYPFSKSSLNSRFNICSSYVLNAFLLLPIFVHRFQASTIILMKLLNLEEAYLVY